MSNKEKEPLFSAKNMKYLTGPFGKNNPVIVPSFLDGIGNGLGYGMILVTVAFFRELLGSGSLLGFRIVPESWYIANGGAYSNMGLMLFPPMALIIVGCIIWIHRSYNKDLQEK